jgi:protein-tyrosine phosphatase
MIDISELVLCATSQQVEYVLSVRPDAASRTFVLGEFGRLLGSVSLDALPTLPYERGVALVEAADAARGGAPSRPEDDLSDPWGMEDHEFGRVADIIELTVVPLASALVGPAGK